MAARLFTLQAQYEGQPGPQAAYSTDEITLRMFGKDHHNSAPVKPDLALIDPDGQAIATMTAGAFDWIEIQPQAKYR